MYFWEKCINTHKIGQRCSTPLIKSTPYTTPQSVGGVKQLRIKLLAQWYNTLSSVWTHNLPIIWSRHMARSLCLTSSIVSPTCQQEKREDPSWFCLFFLIFFFSWFLVTFFPLFPDFYDLTVPTFPKFSAYMYFPFLPSKATGRWIH